MIQTNTRIGGGRDQMMAGSVRKFVTECTDTPYVFVTEISTQ